MLGLRFVLRVQTPQKAQVTLGIFVFIYFCNMRRHDVFQDLWQIRNDKKLGLPPRGRVVSTIHDHVSLFPLQPPKTTNMR